jgi:5'-nucleotidase
MVTYHIIENWKETGLKIGFMGIAEDWINELMPCNTENLIYEDFVKCSERMSHFLKEEESCDFIISLTHMRLPND